MNKKRLLIITNVLFFLFVILLTASLFFDAPRVYVEGQLGDNKMTTGLMYFSVVVIATVLAPLSGLPLAPAVSVIIGPFLTVVYSVLGWTVGAGIAFLIARYLARPFLYRIIDMKQVERYEEYIPQKYIFLWLVGLRIVIPVDILSYAIGLTKRIKFPVYIISTFIGVIPFAFIWTYGGYAFLERDYVAFALFSGIGFLLFFSSLMYYYVRKRRGNL